MRSGLTKVSFPAQKNKSGGPEEPVGVGNVEISTADSVKNRSHRKKMGYDP